MNRLLIPVVALLALLHCGLGVHHALRIPTRPVMDVLAHVDQVLQRELDLLGEQQGAASRTRFPRVSVVIREDTPEHAEFQKQVEAAEGWSTKGKLKMVRLFRAAKNKVGGLIVRTVKSGVTRLKSKAESAADWTTAEVDHLAEKLDSARNAIVAKGGKASTGVKDYVDRLKKVTREDIKKNLQRLVGIAGTALAIAACITPIGAGVMLGAAIAGLAFNMIVAGMDVHDSRCPAEAAFVIGRAVVINGVLVAFGMGILAEGASLMGELINGETCNQVAAAVSGGDVVEGESEAYIFKCPCSAEQCEVRKKKNSDTGTAFEDLTEVTEEDAEHIEEASEAEMDGAQQVILGDEEGEHGGGGSGVELDGSAAAEGAF